MTESTLDAPAGIWTRPRGADADWSRLKDENSRLLAEDIAARSSFFRGLPELVMMNHTDRCNLRCVMCPRHDAQGTHRLERHVLERVTERLFPTARKVGLAASEAEPLLYDFEYLTARAREFGVRVDLTTNGTHLTPELFAGARDVLDHLDVSVDACVPEVYEAIRVGARFERLDGNLRALGELRRREPDDVILTLSAVVMRSTLEHLPALVRYGREVGAQAVILKRLFHDRRASPEEDAERAFGKERVRRVLDESVEAAHAERINVFRRYLGLSDAIVVPCRDTYGSAAVAPDQLCWYLAQNFHVRHTGEVYPCMEPTPYSVGNVLDEDPVEIWNAPGLRRLREAHYSRRGTTFCNGCEHAVGLRAPRFPKVHHARKRASLWIARRTAPARG